MKKLIIILGVGGMSFSAILIRLSTCPTVPLVFYRLMLASVILAPIILWKYHDEVKKTSSRSYLLCLSGGVFLALHFLTSVEALSFTSIASSLVIVNTEVFFVAFGMFIIVRERIQKKGWFGIAATFLGIVIIAFADSGKGTDSLKGDFLALLGAVFMAGYTIIGRIVRRDMSTLLYAFSTYVVCSVFVLGYGLVSGTQLFGYGYENWVIALVLAVVCTLLGHMVFTWGLKYEKAAFVSTSKLLEPVFASIWGVFILSEVPSLCTVLGGIVVIGGVWFYSRNSQSEGLVLPGEAVPAAEAANTGGPPSDSSEK